MASDTTGAAPSTLDTEGAWWWWILAIVTVAAAAVLSVAVAKGEDLTTGHRAAAAWVALLVVMALAV
jgi:ABC-type amino acid transport system permease subunit